MRIVRGMIVIIADIQSVMKKKHGGILVDFGCRVRELRKARGLSQEAFAAECGLDRTYIGGVERGERNIALLNIAAIATTLKVSLSHLMTGLPK